MKAKDVRVTFEECLCACLENEVFLREFDRLTGCQLSGVPHRTPLEAMVDKATEVDESVRLDLRQQQGDVDKFIAFVYNLRRMKGELQSETTVPAILFFTEFFALAMHASTRGLEEHHWKES